MRSKSATNVAKTGCQRVFMILLGAMFTLAALAGFIFGFVWPTWNHIAARRWPSTPCTILSSTVESHSDSDGTTYSPEIRYRYSLDGGEFESDRYSFLKVNSGRTWAEKIVAQYPAGSTSTCYYDPRHPDRAVLSRELGVFPFFLGAFTLIFVIVGVIVMTVGARTRGFAGGNTATTNTASRGAWFVPIVNAMSNQLIDWKSLEGPQNLRPTQSRWAVAMGLGLFTLVWNSFVGFFVFMVVSDGKVAWFMLLFLTPFVLVGLLLILIAIHQFLALFNPKVEVALTNGLVGMGESIDVAWQLTGRTQRIRKLTVKVQGVERASYTRGTDTHTDESQFAEYILFEESNSAEIPFGTRSFQAPASTMHTFKGLKNQIVWKVRLLGDIPWWPNIDESFEFYVKPKDIE